MVFISRSCLLSDGCFEFRVQPLWRFRPLPSRKFIRLITQRKLQQNNASHSNLYPVNTVTMSLTNGTPEEAARAARLASRRLAVLSTKDRNDALTAIHSALTEAKDEILEANVHDLAVASKSAENGELSQSLVKRLDLRKKGKYEDMLQGILDVRDLEDPSTCYTTSEMDNYLV
jgi:hypothetical protein